MMLFLKIALILSFGWNGCLASNITPDPIASPIPIVLWHGMGKYFFQNKLSYLFSKAYVIYKYFQETLAVCRSVWGLSKSFWNPKLKVYM